MPAPDALLAAVAFDANGLVPVIAQEARTGMIRMVAWANREALAEALPAGDKAHTAHEAADLLFHMLVGLEAAGVAPEAVFAELARRFGVSGIDEKASRKK